MRHRLLLLPQLGAQRADCLLVHVVALGQLLFGLARLTQLAPHAVVLTRQVVIAVQQLLRLARLVHQLAAHLLVLHDGALGGRFQLRVGHRLHVGLGVLDALRQLLLQAVLLGGGLARDRLQALRVGRPLLLQQRLLLGQAGVQRISPRAERVKLLHLTLVASEIGPQLGLLRLRLVRHAPQACLALVPQVVQRLGQGLHARLHLPRGKLLGLQLARQIRVDVFQINLLGLQLVDELHVELRQRAPAGLVLGQTR
mmetsp:Transcript_27971/g.70311  ORF Transcript_27971/g.70311 Transcript_27971/m.70311 type:complete len:255 (-) Transcript_27971:429-1193(-)